MEGVVSGATGHIDDMPTHAGEIAGGSGVVWVPESVSILEF